MLCSALCRKKDHKPAENTAYKKTDGDGGSW